MQDNRKPYLPKLQGLVNTHRTWEAFTEMLDAVIDLHHKKLEQAVDPIDLYKAQGAVQALRQLKFLRDEVNASQKTDKKAA